MSKNPWLQLALTYSIGPATAHGLIEHFGSADALVGCSHTQLVNAGLNANVAEALLNPDEDRLAAAIEWLAAENHHLLHWHDARYPPLLLELATSPPVLFVAGDPAALMQPQLAIVGSRNATANGRANAREFADHLVRAGLTITSGLAAGIPCSSQAVGISRSTDCRPPLWSLSSCETITPDNSPTPLARRYGTMMRSPDSLSANAGPVS